jgi:hypothetical protein
MLKVQHQNSATSRTTCGTYHNKAAAVARATMMYDIRLLRLAAADSSFASSSLFLRRPAMRLGGSAPHATVGPPWMFTLPANSAKSSDVGWGLGCGVSSSWKPEVGMSVG